MEKPTVCILFGGMSTEYPVSLESAYAVIKSVDTKKYEPVLVGITQAGEWFRFAGPLEHIADDTWCVPQFCTPAFISPCSQTKGLVEVRGGAVKTVPLDAAFPVMHGTFGEDGTVQGLLELAGIPIVGCGTLASAACMNKDMAHRVVETLEIAVPQSAVFGPCDELKAIHEAAGGLGYPLFVKPVRAGSSFGISKVMCEAELDAAVTVARQFDSEIVLEEGIDGFEVGCAVLGDEELIMGRVDEIELLDGFFDYTEKYNLITSKIHVPARIDAKQEQQVRTAAAAIYKALGCKGFARVDMFVKPDGGLVFNEVNTVPGFTAHSRYPTMMKAIGIEFEELVDRLIGTVVKI